MELNIKTIAAGIALFALGGLSVYLITRSPADSAPLHMETIVHTQVTATPSVSASSAKDTESFYEAAEARREQQLADKAESDRLAKLAAIKERSVECQFWKQQQNTASDTAKVEEKIMRYCMVQTTKTNSSDSTPSELGNTNTAPDIATAEAP